MSCHDEKVVDISRTVDGVDMLVVTQESNGRRTVMFFLDDKASDPCLSGVLVDS